MPYYPYFLVQNCLKRPKKLQFFILALSEFAKSDHLIWAAMMQKFLKYFYFSYNYFFFLNIYFSISFPW